MRRWRRELAYEQSRQVRALQAFVPFEREADGYPLVDTGAAVAVLHVSHARGTGVSTHRPRPGRWAEYALLNRGDGLPRMAGVYAVYFDGELAYIGPRFNFQHRGRARANG